MNRYLAPLAAGVLSGLVAFAIVHAHPGRLNAKGCHETNAPYEYANGTLLPRDFVHCHRTLDDKGVPLDGTQVLDDGGPIDPRRVGTKMPDGRWFICESDGRGNRQCGIFTNPMDSPFGRAD